jgi:hypothetical protein
MFEKYLNIKFHENALSRSPAVPCRRTDVTKLIVAFRNFAKAPKNGRTLASDTEEYEWGLSDVTEPYYQSVGGHLTFNQCTFFTYSQTTNYADLSLLMKPEDSSLLT